MIPEQAKNIGGTDRSPSQEGSGLSEAQFGSRREIFVGVAWPYVNGDLHVGHLAGYLVPADIVARFHRMRGNEVLMASGSDCYGTPITVEADKRGISPEELVAEYHPKIAQLFSSLGLSFDIYTKTMSPNHHRVVQDMFVGLLEKGFIFKDSSLQYFSPTDNRFLPDRYVEGTCPSCSFEQARSDQCDCCSTILSSGELINPISKISRMPVELRKTEHYFLDWPKLQGFLEGYVDSHSVEWRSWVVKETKKWLDEGLKPRAITRDLNWGIPIPTERIPADALIEGHENKRIYVWFEAVIGYFSASLEWAAQDPSRSWKVFWQDPAAKHYYFMGKDNLVFHTLFWPGQLHAFDASLHLPDQPAINHFLTFEGQKFSKSRGVFVDPNELVKNYGLGAVRFYVAHLSPETNDADFSYEGLKAVNNGILVSKIGNFVHRTLTLGRDVDYSQAKGVSPEVVEEIERACTAGRTALENGEIRNYVSAVIKLSEFANRYFSERQPWALKKPSSPLYNMDNFNAVLADSVLLVEALGLMLRPMLPDTADAIESMLGIHLRDWSDCVSQGLQAQIKRVKISDPKPLFQSIDEIVR